MSETAMTIMGFGISFFFIGIVVLISLRLRKNSVKLEDADLPGQIKNIISRIANDDAPYYDLIPARTSDTAGDTAKKLLIQFVGQATGHKIYTYNPGEDFLIIFGCNKLFLIPYVFDLKTKTIITSFERVSEIDKEDLLKIKANKSFSSITFTYTDKESIHFGPMNQFDYNIKSSPESRQAFNTFMSSFMESVNS